MSVLVPGRNCASIAAVEDAGMLVDASDYYAAFYHAAKNARSYLLCTGWQFDSRVELLRGEDAVGAEHPVELLAFLKSVCRHNEALRVYLLAWDYSLVFALEREWNQRFRFDWTTSERIRFHFDDCHPVGGSHHQKFVVIDGQLGFAGGIDLCRGRWDDRRHAAHNPLRNDTKKPYHDLMAYCRGPVVKDLEGVFCERWTRAAGEPLVLPPAASDRIEVVRAEAIECKSVGVSRTFGPDERYDQPAIEEIRTLYQDAIASAEQLIYIETQYFTSSDVLDALLARMRDTTRERIEIVIIMPHGGDTPKEDYVLGGSQEQVVDTLREAARENGHGFGVYHGVALGEDGTETPIFIHSKVLAVDDRIFSVGSANATNRSMKIDSELNFVWECAPSNGTLARTIAKLRGSLIAEQAGLPADASFETVRGLVRRLDELARPGRSRLRHRTGPEREHERTDLLRNAFDPDRPLDQLLRDELLALAD